jgi:FkbM family methyltransferase
MKKLSSALHSLSPSLWQYLQYQKYMMSEGSEREIHFVQRYIDSSRAAIDIGVHLGFYTRHFKKFAKTVIGFEANPVSAKFAQRAFGKSVRIEWSAISSDCGSATLRIPVRPGDVSALGTISDANLLEGRQWTGIVVPKKRLDDFDLPQVGFIKIDVEGHEEAVLRGAEGVIERDRPNFMIEIEERHNPGSIKRAAAWFERRGYGGSYFDGAEMRAIFNFDHTTQQSVNSETLYINNFFFVPRPR